MNRPLITSMDDKIQYECLSNEEIEKRLSPEDIKELRNAFEQFDVHNLGYIPKPDLGGMLRAIGYVISQYLDF